VKTKGSELRYRTVEELLMMAEERRDELSNWQRQFIADMRRRWEEYNEMVFVSKKQRVQLEKAAMRHP